MKIFKIISQVVVKYMAILIVAGAVFGLFFPKMNIVINNTSWIPYLLGVIMYGMGLSVKLIDFKELIIKPKFVIAGVLAQFIIMPLLAWALVSLFNLPMGLAIGVVLLGASPGGTASNVITYLSKGDVALSVAITSCTTFLAPFATPFLVNLIIGQKIDINLIAMFISVIKIVILPIILGILTHMFLPKLTKTLKEIFPSISALTIIIIVTVIVGINSQKILSNLSVIFLVVILHNILGLIFGYFVGKTLAKDTKDMDKVKAITIEVGMQNSGLATSLALLHFAAYPLATVPGALFSVWHNISGGILASIFSRMK
ncbi:bile acid:sodium symporter family protein [Campylobacter blaseri]|uniref:Sodium transporter n=1 Tax=Campylobacter blaseri TaxID=2042961 RepID=A0A2P8R1G0_9BACT|nr:bile acid:sodium symporter family protein [Campylobacter blaseri]PSM52337.1 sodium transporter [Campylobacter blaseri]PSM54103.1 sodium transporter [Campylobacter blaseri]QKF85546.1 bile acid:sodium symporter family protein [Campylobacter blaseri]